ncbi:MAG: hypothetical protein AAF627_16745 [Myxococcota bacterium]
MVVQLGEYRLTARFDLDEPAQCFLAFDADESPVWVRRAAASLRYDDAFLHRFVEEAERAVKLRVPRVSSLRDAGLSDGRPFTVHGPDFGVVLTRMLERFPMSPRAWARMGLDLLDGMEALHRIGLPSGWLLPDRVLCTFDHRFLWMDPTLGRFSLIPSAAELRAKFYDAPHEAASVRNDQEALLRLLEYARPRDVKTKLSPHALRSMLLRLAQDPHLEMVTTRDRFRRLYSRLQASLRGADMVEDVRPVGGRGPVAGDRPVDFDRFAPVTPRLLRGTAGDGWIKLCGTATEAAREAEALGTWASPWTLQLRSVHAEAATPHLVLDGPGARSLGSWLGEDPPGQGQILAWCLDAARALEDLHGRDAMLGAVHGKGLGVVPGGGCVFLDTTHLGPARLDAVRDSPLVLAPEVYGSNPRYELASERFAFGMLVYELLAGTRPFRALQPDTLQLALQTKAPTPLQRLNPEVPEPVSNLVDQLLNRLPGQRPDWSEIQSVFAQSVETSG